MKHAMAAMSAQHFDDIRHMREAGTPRGTPPAAAAGAPHGAARALELSSPRAAGAAAAVGAPVAAHRLEIQVHQLERQLAEQAAKIDAQVGPRLNTRAVM